jgi:CBS domain containing-hemolysin-like protein
LEELTEDHFRKTLGGIKRSLPAFDQDLTLGTIFDSMLKQKSQIAQIIDEYGMFVGILTLEDIIETIFGLEIIDESDTVIDMQQYARERWEQRQKKYKKLTVNNDSQPTVDRRSNDGQEHGDGKNEAEK